MAGQRPTTTEQREAQNHTYQFSFTKAQLTSVQYVPLFTAEVPTVVDFASLRVGVVGGTARTVRLAYAANGTAPGSATNITATLDVNATTANITFSTEPEPASSPAHEAIIGTQSARFWGFMDESGTPAAITYGQTKKPGANVVPKGATVFLVFENSTVGNLDGVVLNVRVTEKLH
jgi:hypothetical protein